MRWQSEFWTYLIVTVVAVLIWFWAAGETRTASTISYARAQLVTEDPSLWAVEPKQIPMTITIDGPRPALQRAEALLRRPLPVEVGMRRGTQPIDLLEALRRSPELAETGVNVSAVEPVALEVVVDEIQRTMLKVRAVLPGVQTADEVVVEPTEIALHAPSELLQRYAQTITAEALIDSAELDLLEPGVRHTREVKLRLPVGLMMDDDTRAEPDRVSVTFTIRSRKRDARVDTMRIQVAGPPEDRDEFSVEVTPNQLRDVVITADSELVRRIEAEKLPVVAVIHLSSREMEARVPRKLISYVTVLVPEADGSTRGVAVEARTATGEPLPPVGLTIRDRRTGSR